MSTKESLKTAYSTYLNSNAEAESLRVRVFARTTGYIAVCIVVMFSLTFILEQQAALWSSLVMAGVVVALMVWGIKSYAVIHDARTSLWQDEATVYFDALGMTNLTPSVARYDPPRTPAGYGVLRVVDPALLYSGTADINGKTQTPVEIRVMNGAIAVSVAGGQTV